MNDNIRILNDKIKDIPNIEEKIKKSEEKFSVLSDIFEIKEKYKTDITKCIETEIYPSIETKLMSKVKLQVDKQFGTIKSQFVQMREFEFQTEDIRNNIMENTAK